MDSVKVPKFSGDDADWPAFRVKFKAFSKRVGCGAALADSQDSTADQHSRLFSDLVLALPDDLLYLTHEVDEDDERAGYLCWAALLAHFEDDGIDRRAEERDFWG